RTGSKSLEPKNGVEKATTNIKGGNTTSIFGVATGVFGAVCPACLGINFLLLGNVFTAQLSFLIPYIFWIQLGGITLLLLGLYLVAKSSYENKCISCSVDDKKNEKLNANGGISSKKLFTGILAVLAIVALSFQVFFVLADNFGFSVKNNKSDSFISNGKIIDISTTIEEVTPKAGFKTDVKWGGIVKKMVEEGVLDPVKLENILTKRYGQEMKPEWRAVLAGKDADLEINNDNAVFMMYLLWTLAKHNENQILFDSPFAKYFTSYDIGVGRAGYGDTKLLLLTPAQQKVAKEVAENANRPCCNNSTAAPDCSHGYSALGLVELMASQNFSKDEIFDVFVKFNSFWFPETYVKNAMYFKAVEGTDWVDVDKELVAGAGYSSLSGSYKVKNYLRQKFGI
ncbi:hypothetical protein MNBD_BACTEROID05-1198, partial [hydrothermal vent metagenome]